MAPEGLLDYVILAVLAAGFFFGMMRGLVAGAMVFVSLAGAWLTAALLTPLAAAWLQERFQIGRWAADLAARHVDMGGGIPALPGGSGEGAGSGLLHPVGEIIARFWPAAADAAVTGVVERAAGAITFGLLFFLLFFLAHLLFRLAGRVFAKIIGSIPVVSLANKILGALFGLAIALTLVTAGAGVAAVLYLSFGWDFIGDFIVSSAYAKHLLTVFSALVPLGPAPGG